ncbi:MAG: hypothetical protein LBE12_04110 [Planctomycetaceae bacterium]|nr:hypothetical protein [Planctomycetaceae bacterium]
MKHFSYFILVLLILSGCQSMPHGQEPTVLVDSRQQQQQQQQSGAAERFLAKAAHFLRGAMPETGHITGQEYQQVAKVKPPAAVSELPQAAVNPSAFYFPSSPKVLRPGSIQASQMLFNFNLAENEPEPDESVPPKPQKNTAKSNLLQPQNGDSESFRYLLKLIAQTPKEERGVDDAKLEQLLAKFRNENWEEMPELETSYLLHLRNKILPNYRSPKKLEKPTVNEIPENEEDEDELYVIDEIDEVDAIDYKKLESAPFPPSKLTTSKSTLSKKTPANSKTTLPVTTTPSKYSRLRKSVPTEEDQEETTDLPETIPVISDSNSLSDKPSKILPPSVFTASESPPPPQNPSQPLYPKITQLDSSQPIVPAGYQAGQHPPYGNQYNIPAEQPTGNIVHAYTNSVNNSIAAPLNQFSNKDWEFLVRMGADQLRNKIEQTPHGRTFANESRLRLLEMLLGNRNEAVKPISGVDKPINEFMANQMLGFTAFLDEFGIPEQRIRNTNALFRFDESLMELRKVCPIKLKKVQFVKEWDTFGSFIPRNEDCYAGEKLELYMELENPTVRHIQHGYNVSATVSYEIRDRAAAVLQKVDHVAVQETTPSQKRDYCIGLRVLLPEKIPPGQYQLRVNVTDMNDEARSYTEEQVPFKVIPVVNPEN